MRYYWKSGDTDFNESSENLVTFQYIIYLQIDVTVYIDGVHGDCSKTFLVGEVDEEGKRLVSITEECLKVRLCKESVHGRDF